MSTETDLKISSNVHPDYMDKHLDWEKFRYVMDGGEDFIDQYLKSYSDREATTDFETRKQITPVSGFATAAITDVKNAIFQRMTDITRSGGSDTYQSVVNGNNGGVDLLGAAMNYFIGNQVLPELLFMGKVGVFVDMPVIPEAQTLRDTQSLHPYFYVYKTEDIRNWRLSRRGEFIEFDMLLLRERILTYDNIYFLPAKDTTRYRLLTLEDGVVRVRFFDIDGDQVDIDGEATTESTELGVKRIPFTVFEINQSLLQNIANHQIALMNLESSDIGYALKSNFPFYTEQQSNTQSVYLKSFEDEDGDDEREIEIGGTVGRIYPKGVNPPMFISPSSEPLNASMEKQKALKEDIRTLINLALSAIQPRYASAAAKQMDEHGLESGLSFLGLILEHGERQLASFFSEYEGYDEVATINYPTRYALKSDADRLSEASDLHEMMLKIPSKSAQKALSKLIIQKLLDAKISKEDLEGILNEIETSEYNTADPNIIHVDLEKGLVSTETASKARGYNSKVEVPKAAQDHADRIKRIKDAQSPGARGIDDLDANSESAKNEKEGSQNTDLQDDTHKPVRGKEQ